MTRAGTLLRHLNEMLSRHAAPGLTDSELLQRFAARRDEAAFAAIVHRHGGRVWRLCRRVLGDEQAAEDAFQATFLVLARSARSIRKSESVASWLYGVAYRVAVRAKRQANLRRHHERQFRAMTSKPSGDELTWRELQALVEEELHRLPARYRMPFVLCCLEGAGRAEAARELGIKEGTLSSRLAHARKLLQERLAHRGVTLAAASAAIVLVESVQADVPAALAHSAVQSAIKAASGGVVAANVASLAQSVTRAIVLTKAKSAGLLLACALLAAGAGTLAHFALPAQGQPPPAVAKTEAPPAPRTDRYGDPLPEGALLRLGTERFRQGNFIYGIALAPDGRTIVSIGGNSVVHVWDAATGRERRRFERPRDFGTFYGVAISPDGKILAAGGESGVLTWDLIAGKELYDINLREVDSLAFSPDGTTLATGDRRGGLILWDAVSGRQQAILREPAINREAGYEVGAVAFSPDGRLLAAGRVSQVHIWDLDNHKLIHQIVSHYNQILALAFSPDGKTLASGSSDRDVRLWDAASGKELHWLRGHQAQLTSLAFTPDGKTLVSGSGQPSYRSMMHEPKAVRLWDVATGKEIAAVGEHGWGVTGVAVMPDGNTLVTGGGGGSICLWDLATRQEIQQREGHHGWIGAVSYSPDGKMIATGGGDNVIRVWGTATGKELRQMRGCARGIDSLDFSADGKLLASGSRDGNARIWEFASAKVLQSFRCSSGADVCVAFCPDGKLLASGTRDVNCDDRIKIWDIATGKELHGFGGPKWEGVWSLRFSPDGKALATACQNEMPLNRNAQPVAVRLWDVATGRELREFQGAEQDGWATSVVFSPDGQMVAAGTWGGAIHLWSTSTGKEVRAIGGPGGSSRIALSPDGRTLAAAGLATVRLLEVATGIERRRFIGGGGMFGEAAFAPDGNALATGNADTTILIWDLLGSKARSARAAPFTPQDLDALWRDLLAADGPKSYVALRTLAMRPVQTVPFVAQQLAPVDAQRIGRLIRDLDSDQFALREQAMTELARCAEQVEPALRRALKGQPSLELRRRVNELMVRTEARAPRITELFELIGTEPARKALEELAKGQTETRLMQEAKAALERWEKRAALTRSRRL